MLQLARSLLWRQFLLLPQQLSTDTFFSRPECMHGEVHFLVYLAQRAYIQGNGKECPKYCTDWLKRERKGSCQNRKIPRKGREEYCFTVPFDGRKGEFSPLKNKAINTPAPSVRIEGK